MGMLLAIDLGLRTGLALYGPDGRLVWYRSQNFGSAARLRRAVHGILRETNGLTHLVLEGGGHLAEIWEKEAIRRGIRVMRVAAEQWRRRLLYPRQQRTGVEAKRSADDLARRIIEWAGTSRPTSLRHDAAEAVLVGFWAVMELGWLAVPPPGLNARD